MIAYSIVIVTYRRHQVLCDTIRTLAQQVNIDSGEVIVIDQCPEKPLAGDILELPCLRYVTVDQPGMVKARNLGLSMALGCIVIYLDDDIVPLPDLIPAHLSAYTDPLVGGVAGRILDYGEGSAIKPSPRVFDLEDGWRHACFNHGISGNVMTARGCNMSFRRELLMRLGGFDSHIEIFRDDTDMCFRVLTAGHVVRFLPAAVVVHLNAGSGGTRGSEPPTSGLLQRELAMYLQSYRHYRDNLYFISKHFRGWKRLKWLADAYRTYVGISRWPWRLVAKNACFFAALVQAFRLTRNRRQHPCDINL